WSPPCRRCSPKRPRPWRASAFARRVRLRHLDCEEGDMAYDRLTGLDASFLHLESEAQPMHVGSLAMFEGASFFDEAGSFRIEDAREIISTRLHLVPLFRKKLMTVPLGQGRPIWVDDHDFDLNYHVRLTALPKPGSEEQLKTLMGRLQATVPREIVRSVRAVLRGPRQVAQTVASMGKVAPRTPFNVAVGPHRRFEVVRADLGQVKDIKKTLGGSVNDVVLAAVTGGLRHFLEARKEQVDGVTLKAFVPVSVRDDSERMALGNRVSGIMVDLPVGNA